jgi:hypothetical protein
LAGLAGDGHAVVQSNSSGSKVAHLTTKGLKAQAEHPERIHEIENQWHERFGSAVERVTETLAAFVGGGMAANSPLFAGLEPAADGWRGEVTRPDTLPQFPMILHRGGFPDGS